jgi:hypothetical protein
VLKSRITNYFNAKYPWLYHLSIAGTIVILGVWIFGIFVAAYLLTKGPSPGVLFWEFAWTIGGIVIFTLSFWWTLGTQTIEVSSQGIRVTKTFGPLRLSKLIRSSKIISLDIRKFEPFNFLTGNEIHLDNGLGWLVINGEIKSFLHSYLYDLDELHGFIMDWRQKVANRVDGREP